MLLELYYCILITISYVLAKDDLLESLYGVNGLNKVLICGDNGVNCEGALWTPQWAVGRGSCVADAPLDAMVLMKDTDGENCEDLPIALTKARKVLKRMVHPSYRGGAGSRYDIALLSLGMPYPLLEPLANVSAAHSQFWQYEMWMKYAIETHQREQMAYVNPYALKSGIFASPVHMFMATVVLPSTSFIIFFIFVIFYTSPKNNNKLYQNNHFEKDPSSI